MSLEDKVAIVTGAGQGIGRTTALRFARDGAQVAVVEINEETGQSTVQASQDQGAEAFFVHADVADHADAARMVDTVHEHFGRIDVLINNAGILRDAQLHKMEESDFDDVINVNLKGTFNCTQAVAPIMREQGSGSIVNAASVVGLHGNFGQTNYVASKAGVIGMAKTWAKELGRKGVRVNAVAPGFIGTEMIQSMPEKVVDQMQSQVPMGRLGDPEEVAAVYAFLASDEASYINGTVISVDGGVVV